ncbi:FHF complex subunit HOOK-interacting protein 1A [Trichomycterus rosablanca]|uniref:FHF complex subunit HOOK-interacting protein 1A n=1 Tax=Trichomycterus rosablanca TaxID=2290929 RepID=UPI002F35E0D9
MDKMMVFSDNRGQGLKLSGVDPETCMIVFKNHWSQVLRILEKHEPMRNGGHLSSGPIQEDEESAVQNYVEHMLFLLTEEESGVDGAIGPILEFVLLENVMERLFVWSLRRNFTVATKLEQLRMYKMLLARARQPLLHHKPILCPLAMLLSSCSSGPSSMLVETQLVCLLHRLSCLLVHDDSALQLFLFQSGQDHGAANFLLFSLLLPFVHRDGPVGEQARDALALIVAVSAHNTTVANYVIQNTYFCPVLATGLSALYSWLPAKLENYSEGWHCLEEVDCAQVPALTQFLNSLQFCSTMCTVAHCTIRDQLLSYIYNGFLVPVMAPALHKLTLEEVMMTTAYLELFLRSITNHALLQIFLIFILRHRHDNISIVDTLVSRINTPFQLGSVSLTLFRTLIGLYCEDVMLQLILRYLIPCAHLLYKGQHRLRERDCYSSSAAAFLALMPSFLVARPPSSPTLPPKPDYILWSKVTEGLIKGNMGNNNTQTSVHYGVGHYCLESEPLMDRNYLQYLNDARSIISTSVQACKVWSAPYDGLNPTPESCSGVEFEDGKDEELLVDDCPPLFNTSLQPPNTHRLSDSSLSRTPVSPADLEWDDSYEAVDREEHQDSLKSHNSTIVKLPKHIEEMQKSASMLIRDSYIEESDFQHDVLVYNLIAQRDLRDDRRASIKNCQTTKILHPHPQTKTKNNTQPQTCNHINNMHKNTTNYINHKVEELEESKSILNGLISEHETNNKLPHITHNMDLEMQDPSHKPLMQPTEDYFISQCLQLIHTLGGDDESTQEDKVDFQRLTALLYGEEKELDFDSFCSDSHDDDDDDDGDDDECSAKQSDSDEKKLVPFTGPFISVLLSRLENMLENSVEVNLLVTGVLAQLAAYPQPLLRCFLLSTQHVFQPSVCSLYQVLVSVGCQIEQYAATRPEFAQMVRDAAQYVLLRDEAFKDRELNSQQKNGLGCFFNGHIGGQLLKSLPPCPKIPLQCRNRVFATFMYAEFLKELAAIAQEHAICPDIPSET